MRIFRSFGSEHSMNLVLIGRFQSLSAAEAAAERMGVLQELAEAQWSDDDWRRRDDRMSDDIREKLLELKLYDFGRTHLDMFAFDYNVERKDATLRIWSSQHAESAPNVRICRDPHGHPALPRSARPSRTAADSVRCGQRDQPPIEWVWNGDHFRHTISTW